ncbi:cytochrome c-type biogenesis protein [Oleiagrimonas sp.]|jgi:cytochrome c-type biogenesis protein CcmH|uniref:cytochrome c-type biogenesis protein n=1 Tax=Oleiagrimonas sp. TaxID=2010330 RepID=UPI00260A5BFE|nr:cytochrome c-type biogenesis protein [Oleiagrimonas sp.]MDA3914542.1 cytochrome c-type biogenesis protein CcmH [Oleiagrimonas sp.]
MKHLRPLLLLVGLCMVFAVHAIDPLPFKNRAQEVRFQKLTAQLRCLVCQNESLAASQAELAQQMRHIIFRKMQEGQSNAQIKQYLVDRYSDYVLYDPPLKPSTWLLWFGPAIVLVLGAGGVWVTIRRRTRTKNHPAPEAETEDW